MSENLTSNQYITFRLGNELFAVDVASVREVLDLTQITHVPTAPPYMRGVVNVRGSAIPVVDLRQKFGLPVANDTSIHRILVLELSIDGEQAVLGGIADSVHEVIELEPARSPRRPPSPCAGAASSSRAWANAATSSSSCSISTPSSPATPRRSLPKPHSLPSPSQHIDVPLDFQPRHPFRTDLPGLSLSSLRLRSNPPCPPKLLAHRPDG
jgi:chemotaxis signal transduction protein